MTTTSRTVAGIGLVAAAFGAADGLIALVSVEEGGGLAVLALSAGLWFLASFGASMALDFALRTGLGAGLGETVVAAGRSWRRMRAERGTVTDRRRSARIVAFLAAASVWAGIGAAILAWLIQHRHGPWLIAITFVVAQIGVALLALWSFRVVDRLARRALRNARWSSTSLLAALALVVATSPLGVFLFQRELWDAVRAFGLVFGSVGAATSLLLGPAIGRRIKHPRVAAAALVAGGVGLSLLGGAVPPARSTVATKAPASRHLLAVAQSASDFDGDGSPTFPNFDDCAPLDPARSPLAAEADGDGVDSNCDGKDSRPDRPLQWRLADVTLPEGQPDLVLVTIDSWRADTVGFGGSKLGITPNLDAFAAEGIVFENAWSQDSGTGPSLWSMMAGKTPFQTELESEDRFPPRYADSEITLAARLQKAGYRTAAVLCGSMFGKKHWNIRRGFDDYREVCGARKAEQAPVVVRDALKTLRELRSRKSPFFLWIHLYDPHRPYHDHGAPSTTAWDRYVEEVAYTDASLEPLLSALAGSSRRTYVAVTADHGENFGEHGKSAHARTLYREVTHVPFVLWGSDTAPGRVEAAVAINDVHPTFLELAGQSTAHSTMTSLAPLFWGAEYPADRLVFQENSFSRPRRHVKGVVGRGHHLIYDMTNDAWELYDLITDPGEKSNLYGSRPEIENELVPALEAFVATTKLPEHLLR